MYRRLPSRGDSNRHDRFVPPRQRHALLGSTESCKLPLEMPLDDSSRSSEHPPRQAAEKAAQPRNQQTASLTRAQVAAHLGVSTSTVRRMEGSLLHPVTGDDGVHRFDPGELASAMERRSSTRPRRRSEGELAALVFDRFQRGATLRALVTEFREPPVTFRRLYREWITSLEDGERQRRRAVAALRQREEDARMQMEVRRDEQETVRLAREWEQFARKISGK
jgi:hypothetical protein